MFSLNTVGSKILDLIDKGQDEAEIAREVSAAYGVDIATAWADVHSFLNALSQCNVLQPENGSGTRGA
jgi:hypothetical protein